MANELKDGTLEMLTKDLLSVQTSYGVDDEIFAGALIGVAVHCAEMAGITKGRMIANVSACYNDNKNKGVPNDV